MIAMPCRARVAGAALLVVLFASQTSHAQIHPDRWWDKEFRGQFPNMATGVGYDIVNQRKAERRLGYLQGKLGRDEARGNDAAAERDAQQIRNVSQRIAVDEWLIRKNLLQDPGCYPLPPRLDPITCAAIGQYRRPPHTHYAP